MRRPTRRGNRSCLSETAPEEAQGAPTPSRPCNIRASHGGQVPPVFERSALFHRPSHWSHLSDCAQSTRLPVSQAENWRFGIPAILPTKTCCLFGGLGLKNSHMSEPSLQRTLELEKSPLRLGRGEVVSGRQLMTHEEENNSSVESRPVVRLPLGCWISDALDSHGRARPGLPPCRARRLLPRDSAARPTTWST